MTAPRALIRYLDGSPFHHLLPLMLVALLLAIRFAHADPAYPADAMVFVSAEVVDTILSAADDSEYQLPGLAGASLRIIKLRNNFAEHPGQLKGELEARLPRRDQPLKFTTTARLRTEADPKRPGLLLLRPEIVTLSPELNGGMLDNALTMVAAATVRGALNTLANTMPALDLELQRQIRLAQPASSQPLEFRIGGASVSAELQVPPLAMDLRVSTRDLRFSQRGVFALLDIGPTAAAPVALSLAADPVSVPVNVPVSAPANDQAKAPASQRANGQPDHSDIAAPDDLAALRALEGLVPADTQTFVHIRGDALARLAMVFNTLPQQARTLSLHSTWSHGKLFSRKRLGLGCGTHGRLLNPGAVVGEFSLGALQARWYQQQLALQLPLWVELETQARVNINGFPSPCGLMSPRPRCRCARGKTRFRVQSRVSEPVQLFAAIAFSADTNTDSDSGSGIHYAIALNAPTSLTLSPRLQLGRIGSLSVAATLPMPHGEVAQGSLPLLLDQRGRISMGGGLGSQDSVSRDYHLRLSNSRIHSDASGLSASFSLSLAFSR